MFTEQPVTSVSPPRVPAGHLLQLRSGKKLLVRPFNFNSETDYHHLVTVDNAIDPDHRDTVENWQHWDRNRNPEHLYRRYLAERRGEIVAYGSYGHMSWSFLPDKYFLSVGVSPLHERKGYGSALWDFLHERLMQRDPVRLVSFTREHRTHALAFLQKRGFEVKLRAPISRINPQEFDAARYAAKVASVEQSGIVVKTMTELSREDPDWKQKIYELEWECVQDVPSVDDFTNRDFAAFEKQTFDSPTLLPDGWFIAVDGDRYVGLSVLWRNLADEKKLSTGLTGVVRSHRRRGLATAMKVRALEFARAYGATVVDTDNEENNPMFQLNLQLGFTPRPALLEMNKQIREQGENER